MSGIKPARRWQPAFYPFKREKFSRLVLAKIELGVKGPLFGYLHTKVPGVSLPEKILKRMEKAGESAPEEGIQITLELIDSIKRKQGVNGIHIMTLGWESMIQRIVTESNLADTD